MSRENTRDLKDFRDAVDGALREIEEKKALIEQLSEKIKGLNAIMARAEHCYGLATRRVNTALLADEKQVASLREALARDAADRLAQFLLQEGFATISFETRGGYFEQVEWEARAHLHVIKPEK